MLCGSVALGTRTGAPVAPSCPGVGVRVALGVTVGVADAAPSPMAGAVLCGLAVALIPSGTVACTAGCLSLSHHRRKRTSASTAAAVTMPATMSHPRPLRILDRDTPWRRAV